MPLPKTMKTARLHETGAPLVIDELPVPEPRPEDVLVRVHACGIVPNLGNVLANWTNWFPWLPLPPFPASFGLDPAGEIVAVGSRVRGLAPGQRVYVNPGRSCGSCRHCAAGDPIACRRYAFSGYFGFSEAAIDMFRDYPFGGLSEYMTAPASAIVTLPDNVTYPQAARFGYIGTAYSALRKAGAGPSTTVLINGGSGTLGLGGVISALALGVPRILCTGRDAKLLEDVRKLAPRRIETFAIGKGSIAEWAKARTDGEGVDAVIDCLGPGADQATFLDAMLSMRRGGRTVNIGAVAGDVPINIHWLMDANVQLICSAWFTTREGQDLADMAGTGVLDLSCFEHHCYPLAEVNTAISGIAVRHGGFSNFVINP